MANEMNPSEIEDVPWVKAVAPVDLVSSPYLRLRDQRLRA